MFVNSVYQKPEDRRHKILAYLDQYIKENDYSPSDREILDYLQASGTAGVHFHIENMENDGWITSLKTEKGHRKQGSVRLTDLGRQELAKYAVPSSKVEHSKPVDESQTAEPIQKENGHPKNNPDEEMAPGKPRQPIYEVEYVVLTARLSSRKSIKTINVPVLNIISASFGNEVHTADPSLSGLGPESYLALNQDMLPARLKTDDLFALEVRGDSMIEAGIESGDYIILKPTQTAENGDMCVVWIDGKEATLKYFYREDKRVRLEPANKRMAPMLIGPSHEVTIQGRVVLVVRV